MQGRVQGETPFLHGSSSSGRLAGPSSNFEGCRRNQKFFVVFSSSYFVDVFFTACQLTKPSTAISKSAAVFQFLIVTNSWKRVFQVQVSHSSRTVPSSNLNYQFVQTNRMSEISESNLLCAMCIIHLIPVN